MQSVFPQIDVQCFFFHLAQCNWRQLVNLDLGSHKICVVTALAFLPYYRIKSAAAQLNEQVSEVVEFIQYVEKHYIGSEKSPGALRMRLAWQEARFPSTI